VANGDGEHVDIYQRINTLETSMAKLETELPHVAEVVRDVKRWQIGTVTSIIIATLLYVLTQALMHGG